MERMEDAVDRVRSRQMRFRRDSTQWNASKAGFNNERFTDDCQTLQYFARDYSSCFAFRSFRCSFQEYPFGDQIYSTVTSVLSRRFKSERACRAKTYELSEAKSANTRV